VRVLADKWGAARIRAGKSESYVEKAKRRVVFHFPRLIDMPAAKVTMEAVDEAIEAVGERRTMTTRKRGERKVGGAMASRNAGATLRAIFTWAASPKGRRLIPKNPFKDGVELPPAVDRIRVLSIAELRRIYAAAGTLGYPDAQFIRLLMLSGCRRAEIANLKWEEVVTESDGGKAILLAPSRTKTKVTHHIPLAPEVVTLIEDCRRHQIVGSPFVLTHLGWGGITNFARIIRRLERAIGEPKIEGWVLHDFRAALVSNLAERGFDAVMLDRLLGHAPVKLSRIAQVYQRSERRSERREALQAWARLLTQTGEIVPIKKAATA
jgi:integrase